jgi:hypothetical protein
VPEIVIDKILEETDGAITLTLTQAEDWEALGVMDILQKRLNEYIYTIREGLFLEKYPQYRGRRIRIRLFCYNPPSQGICTQLDKANQAMIQMGIEFLVTHIEVGP